MCTIQRAHETLLSSSSGIGIEPLFFRTVTRRLVTVREKVVVLESIYFFSAAPCDRTDLNKHNASLGKPTVLGKFPFDRHTREIPVCTPPW